jgi:hypothetical protein
MSHLTALDLLLCSLEAVSQIPKTLREKHKVLHSYSRAEENAFVDGVRDDEILG